MIKSLIKGILNRIKPIRCRGRGNTISVKSKCLRNFTISVDGNNNRVEIADDCILSDTKITIHGDNNKLFIDATARLMGPCVISMHNDAALHIGENAGIRGVTFIVDRAAITIGKLCMFSYNIILRTTDSHRVIGLSDNEVVNTPKSITLGNHVWIGQNATILKGAEIGDDSIVAMGAVVTKGCPPNCIVAGNPAKVVKTGITWDY